MSEQIKYKLMMDNEVRCPNCSTTKYANVNLRMMVNVCGHSLCESCVEQLFVKGAAKCPTCDVVLKRTQFRIQLYDDEAVEKDLEIRRRLLKDICLKEDDFDTLDEYNDYLEKFETFVFNLANDIDIIDTNKQIDLFKTENAHRLTKGRSKISKDMELIEQYLEEEQELESTRDLNFGNGISMAAQKAAARKENLVDDLLSSDLPAEIILRSHKEKAESELAEINELEAQKQQQRAMSIAAKRQQKITFSSGIRYGSGVAFDEHMDENSESYRYVYVPIKVGDVGPPCPTPRTLQNNHYLHHIRLPNKEELAGGFFAIYPCQRALQEAFFDLTFKPNF